MAKDDTDKLDSQNEGVVTFQTSQGTDVQGTLLRLRRHLAAFEMYNADAVLRTSELLTGFMVTVNGRKIYSGSAVVSNLIEASTAVVCEATLNEGWLDVPQAAPGQEPQLRGEFHDFLQTWEKNYRLLPEFKLAVADLESILEDMRIWLGQVEVSVMAQPAGRREAFEREIINQLQGPVLPVLGALFEKFEEVCKSIPPDFQAPHRAYVQRRLHPIVLCAPFMRRTFLKPLGYAGDYEMVAMMMRDPQEGASLFAKVLNTFFLNTPPVVAHRNRIEYLKVNLEREVARVAREGRVARIFNLGCGPAKEIQEFVAGSPLSNKAQFTLLDFNEETLSFTGNAIASLIKKNRRSTSIQMVKKSVAQVIKESLKTGSTLLTNDYDLVYCAGLFDYMPQVVCQQLVATFYKMAVPGGLVLATNVHALNPSRNWMEYSVDWHLVYRDRAQMTNLVPETAPPDSYEILTEPTGVNTFVEIRKPKHA